jgi:ADP-ribose pyrophosphatase YjhB (NUDIX family)
VRRLYPNQPLVGIGGVIICDGRILLEKRKYDPGRGRWSIPGGLVDLGEKVEQAVIREVREETGLDVDQPEYIDVVDNVVLDEKGRVKYHFIIIDFFVKLKGGLLKAASDAAELEWVLLDEVESYDLTKTFRDFFEKNKQKLESFNSCL